MPRPFLKNSVVEMREFFTRFPDNIEALREIREELDRRSTDASQTLLREIRAHLNFKQVPAVDPPDNVTSVTHQGENKNIKFGVRTSNDENGRTTMNTASILTPNESLHSNGFYAADSPQAKAAKPKVDELRSKLLDLSTRNRLLSFKHLARGGRFIRVVDESATATFKQLQEDESVELVPLEKESGIPGDEEEPEFLASLDEALLTEKTYLKEVAKIALEEADDSEAKMRKAERALRDRLRRSLKMPTRGDVQRSAREHAISLGLNADFDLTGRRSNSPGKRSAKKWQTLLDETDLGRRLRGLASDARESRQEYGIDTLHFVFGFLEWAPPTPNGESEEVILSPLILQPIGMDRKNSQGIKGHSGQHLAQNEDDDSASPRSRSESYVFNAANSEPPQVNLTLRERLKVDYQLHLPELNPDEPDIEQFFLQLAAVIKDRPWWRIRKFVTLANLSFSRLSMWIDLDPDQAGEFAPYQHKLIAEIFGGRETNGSNNANGETGEPQTTTYPIPNIILDCDSSQYDAIRRALAGQNLVIQGPPGTGKSQTIANLIAAALAEGKRVLFVAEKQVALEVVHKSLKDAGLEDFVLELHSAKAGKRPILDSILKRLDRPQLAFDIQADETLRANHANVEKTLNEYAKAMGRIFGKTGWTVHDILWREIKNRKSRLPASLAIFVFDDVVHWTKDEWDARRSLLIDFGKTSKEWNQATESNIAAWSWVGGTDIHIQEQNEILHHYEALQKILEAIIIKTDGSPFVDTKDLSREALGRSVDAASALGKRPKISNRDLWLFARINGAEDVLHRIFKATTTKENCFKSLQLDASGLLVAGANPEELLAEIGRNIQSKYLPPAPFVMADLRSQLHETQRILTHLTDVSLQFTKTQNLDAFRWLSRDVSGLNAWIKFVVLAESCPDLLTHKRHNLGESGALVNVQDMVNQGRALRAKVSSMEQKIRQPLTSLSQTEVDEAIKIYEESWIASYLFSPAYRKTCRLLTRLAPTLPRAEASKILREISSLLKEVSRFEQQLTQPFAAGLFDGINTDFCLLDQICAWAQSVFEATPVLDNQSGPLRGFLFKLTPDWVILAKSLKKEGFIENTKKLVAKARQESCTIDKLEELLNEEIQAIRLLMESANKLVWTGPISAARYELISTNFKAFKSAEVDLEKESDAVRLLSPNLTTSVLEFKLIAKARNAARLTNLPDYWFDLSTSPDGESAWDAAHSRATELQSSLTDLDALVTKIAALTGASDEWQVSWCNQAIPSSLDRVKQELNKIERFRIRCRYNALRSEVIGKGLTVIADAETSLGNSGFSDLGELFEHVAVGSLSRKIMESIPEVREFRFKSPAASQAKFQELDQSMKTQDRSKLANNLFARHIPAGVGVGLVKQFTQKALLDRVCRQQKPRVTVRDLIHRSGPALVAAKPCFLMSPLSVAQLIPKKSLEFDLVIFDEASQIRPEDALCSMLRAKQFVVVGDQKQLPPTSFGVKGSAALDADQDEEWDDGEQNTESILELANSAYGDGVMLRWHYRSRDPSLISFSNAEFYENKLQLFPKPSVRDPNSGVKHIRVDGTYGNRINIVEAKRCAEEAIAFMQLHPARSLGIVAVNKPQADLIELELARLIDTHPHALAYRANWEKGIEPIFVKNLESVQGDQRDVIFISTVFAPDENGNFFQRFGPLNSKSGHRRLNVIITRAKHQVVVVSSIDPGKIVVAPNSHPGVGAFRRYLEFAQSGILVTKHRITGKPTDSPFEDMVIAALKNKGYDCEPQVGVSGFFIDIGVRNPDNLDQFLIGVECDGASYHGSACARDRDRLRQEILVNLGWKIHRIWSTDWFRDPERQLEQLIHRLQFLRENSPVSKSDSPSGNKGNGVETTANESNRVDQPQPGAKSPSLSVPVNEELTKLIEVELAAESDINIRSYLIKGLHELPDVQRVSIPCDFDSLLWKETVIEVYNRYVYNWLEKFNRRPWQEIPWPDIEDNELRLFIRAHAIRGVVARFRKSP